MSNVTLRSTNGSAYRLKVDINGCLKTEGCHCDDVSRVVLESPNGFLFEIKINNQGQIIIFNPPKSSPPPPPPKKIILEDAMDNEFELFVSNNGRLHLESLQFNDLEPFRLWFSSSDFRSGLEDVKASIYLGSSLIVSDLLLSEIGSSGVYTLFYTPIIAGEYTFKMSSDTLSSLSIIKRSVSPMKFNNLFDDLFKKNDKINLSCY